MPHANTARIAIAVAAVSCLVPFAAPSFAQPTTLERGRYVAVVAGCNACHTDGFGPSAGAVPQDRWLMGSAVGHRGPWGTTYPPNLRIYMQRILADQWVKNARTVEMRPPMPWFDLRVLTDDDLRALHAFVLSLGPVGQPAPDYVPPGVEPKGPVILYPEPPAAKKP